jgi:uncharacterized protein YbaP (TraB family)
VNPASRRPAGAPRLATALLALALAAGAWADGTTPAETGETGVPSGVPREPGTGALLWRVRTDVGELYLLGSVHVLRPGDLPLPAPVLDAYARSETIALELDLGAIAPGELERALIEFGTAPPTRPLEVAVGEEYTAIREALEAAGYDAAALDRFDPWFVSTAVINRELAALGFRAELGVESQLSQRAREEGKRVTGLETISQQLGIFESLDAHTQARMLRETLEELDTLDEATSRTITAWRHADIAALRAELADPFEDQPALYERLVVQRNESWMPAIMSMLETPETEFVVVGALHVVGRDSVVALLRARGLVPEALW